MDDITVFISYSHDSEAHRQRVRALAESLIKLGLKVALDQFVIRPEFGWPHWCKEQLKPENTRFVLMVCTQQYYAGVENEVDFDQRRGVFWEGALIHNYLYKEKANKRFIPVLLDGAPPDHVPLALQQHQSYRIKDFALTDEGFERLYRELTARPAYVPPEPGQIVDLPPRPFAHANAGPPLAATSAKVSQPAPRFDIDRIYAYAPEALIGREAETAVIAEAWEKAAKSEAHPHVLAFVALGGEGKTSLVAHWAVDMAARGWPGAEAAFAWSFYRQSSSEQAGASSDLFFAEALRHFELPPVEGESGDARGKRLARAIGDRRAVLVLDGLEPLQYAPSAAHNGELKDDALRALLRGLSTRNAGLCLVTTRYRIDDLRGPAVVQRPLDSLTDEAGAELLARLGVKGTEKERRKLSADVKGHALTLEIFGGYLRDAHGGDIARRDRVKLSEANVEEKRGHAFRAMAAYVDWFESGGAEGARALAMLRLTGLFDRPASAGCLAALWRGPAIAGLTEPLVNSSGEQRNIVLKRLEDAKLLTVARSGGALVEIDAHPLLREYFADALCETRAKAWKAAHKRLYEHLTKTPDKPTPTLEELQPLYQAVAHGCAAGLWQETCEKVYHERICRRGEAYVVRKLGAFGADLGAVACFFAPPWMRVSPQLEPAYQAWLMNEAGFRLRALGRLGEAREPMRAGMEMRVAQGDWKNAAVSAGSLSELELTLGEIEAAVRLGTLSVEHADRSGDAFERLQNRTTHADALHQAARQSEAEALFAEAEAMQAEQQAQYSLLYSLAGFRYCDLRLGGAERAAWRRLVATAGAASSTDGAAIRDIEAMPAICTAISERAKQTLAWVTPQNWLLDIGLDHLTLARAALYTAALRGEPPPADHVDAAFDFIRRAAAQEFIPRPLLTRALHRAVTGDFRGAREDLDEAHEIAERGPMRLHLADIHLHRARLFGLLADRPSRYPWTSPQDDLAQARKLIVQCGYNRRLPELEDAEAALRALSA